MAGHSKWSEIKRQKGLTERRDLARQASRRMIARGERPLYRPRLESDGDFILIRIPELDIVSQARHPAGGRGDGPRLHRHLARRSDRYVRHRGRGGTRDLTSNQGHRASGGRRSSHLSGDAQQTWIRK